MKRTIATAVLVLMALFGAQPEASAELGVEVIFSDGDIAIIGAWYRDHEHMQSHGHGGKKAKGLPPGIAKNLARGIDRLIRAKYGVWGAKTTTPVRQVNAPATPALPPSIAAVQILHRLLLRCQQRNRRLAKPNAV